MDSKKVRRIGAAATVVPVLDHLISPTLGYVFGPVFMRQLFGDNMVLVVIFFIALGLFQLAWIGVILKSSNRSLLALGIVVFSFSIAIYLVSTQMWLPFEVPPQALNPFAFLIKGLEAVFVLASISLLGTRSNVRT